MSATKFDCDTDLLELVGDGDDGATMDVLVDRFVEKHHVRQRICTSIEGVMERLISSGDVDETDGEYTTTAKMTRSASSS